MKDDEIELTKNREKVIDYIIKYPECLLQRATLQDVFTIVDKPVVDINEPKLPGNMNVYKYRFVSDGKQLYGIESFNRLESETVLSIIPTGIEDIKDRLIAPRTRFTLKPGDIVNYPDNKTNKPIVTSFGKFIFNYVMLVDCFKDVIPYINTEISIRKLNSLVGDYLLNDKVTTEQCKKMLINLTYLEIPEYIAPNLTTNALRIPDNIKKLKQELIEKYKDRLKAEDPVAMVDVEQPLIKTDKENMKDDYSSRYLLSKKQWNIIRKKMMSTAGMSEKFGEPGKFSFVPNSLSEGWTQQTFPQIANDIRMGSHSRSMETAKGGEVSKFILRVLQNVKINIHDCKSTSGERIHLDEENKSTFIGRNVIQKDRLVLLTEDNVNTYMDKDIIIRSPIYCKAPDGFCYTCVNHIFEQLGQEYIATSIQNFSSAFLTLSLKAVHGKSVETVRVTKFNKYTI